MSLMMIGMTSPFNEGDRCGQFICVPPLKDGLHPNTYEFIGPRTIEFAFVGRQDHEDLIIISFHESCDRGTKKLISNQATAVIKQLKKISIIPF